MVRAGAEETAAASAVGAEAGFRPEIAAAICTRDRPEQLERALQSLLGQSVAPAVIIVVDNAPRTDQVQRLVQNRFPSVRYVREDVQGLDFARNRALREASQEVVAFLDDDAVADPGWIAETSAVFRESDKICLCTGRVEPLTLETEGQRLFEANGGFGRGDQRIVLPAKSTNRLNGLPAPSIAWCISVGSGCSLAVRREAILELGGFDEALDMGAALPGGGDLDIIWRAVTAGHTVVYEPRVSARHEHRREVEDAVNQILGHNTSLIVVLQKALGASRGRARAGVLAFLGWRLLKPFWRLLRKAVGRDPLPLSALLRLPVACWSGIGMYSRMQALARRRAATAESATA